MQVPNSNAVGDPDFNLALKAPAKSADAGQNSLFTQTRLRLRSTSYLQKRSIPHGSGEVRLMSSRRIEIPLYDNVAEIDRDRANQTRVPRRSKGVGDVPHPGLQHIGSTNLETRSTGAAVDRVEVSRYVMTGIAERADYDVTAAHPPGVGLGSY